MHDASITYVDFANRKAGPPSLQNENAAPAGPRNGVKSDRKAAKLPEASYKALDRLDAIALDVEPDEDGRLPSAVLLAIGLADVMQQDPDLEPWLGYQSFGPFGIFHRDDYAARNCLDLELDIADTGEDFSWPEYMQDRAELGRASFRNLNDETEDDELNGDEHDTVNEDREGDEAEGL